MEKQLLKQLPDLAAILLGNLFYAFREYRPKERN